VRVGVGVDGNGVSVEPGVGDGPSVGVSSVTWISGIVGGVDGSTKAVPKMAVMVWLGRGNEKGVGGAAPGSVQARTAAIEKIREST